MQVPRLQVEPPPQNPQVSVRPQPSLAVPQTLLPHACATVQQVLPQVTPPPQPSPALPQVLPPHAWAAVNGVQHV